MGVGKDTVAKIWADHSLKPWHVTTFKVSNDPRFEEKLVDVVGVYFQTTGPGGGVLLRREDPVPSSGPHPAVAAHEAGQAGTMTHDYKRNGTIDLFAAMNIANGQVLTDLHKGHTCADVLRFFKQIDASVPRGLGIHVILDNLSAHSTPDITKWLATKTVDAGTFTSPHLQFLAQPDRAVVQRTHRQTTPKEASSPASPT